MRTLLADTGTSAFASLLATHTEAAVDSSLSGFVLVWPSWPAEQVRPCFAQREVQIAHLLGLLCLCTKSDRNLGGRHVSLQAQ